MGFESPAILWALPAMALPLVLHFYLRGRAPTVALDALMHLVLAGGATAMRLRWIHGILLAVRVAVLAVLILLFARPYLVVPAVVGAVEPISFALVIDDSLSMRLASGGTTPWERAKAQALKVLSELPPDSEVIVVAASQPPRAWPGAGGTWTAERAARHVGRMSASRGGTDLAQAVRTGLERVRAAGPRHRRMWIASDFRESGLAGFPDADERAGVTLTTFDAAGDTPASNRAVVGAVAVSEAPVPANRVRVQVELRNDAEAPFADVLSVRIGLASIARKVECPPWRTCAFEFVLDADEEARFGEARIAPDDLPEDDVRWFSLSSRGRNAVLLVNGSPRRQVEQDETFFLDRALALRLANAPGTSVIRVAPTDLSPVHLSAVDVVVLANVGLLRPDQVQALVEFASRGGGVLITAGDTFDRLHGPVWAGLLPALPRDRLGAPSSGFGLRLRDAKAAPSALRAIAELLEQARVHRLSLLDDGWPADARILVETDSGAPLLVERRLGAGGVLVWLTTIDRDWTDLPLRPAYAPFVRWMVESLQSFSAAGGHPAIRVGESRRVTLPAGSTRAEIRVPAGERVRMAATGDFTATAVPGVYHVRFFGPPGDMPTGSDLFVVNVDPAESALARPDTLPVASPAEPATPGEAPMRKVPWHPWLLGIALSLFLVEAWLRGKA